MKANFMFAIAAIMLTHNVIALPIEDTIEVIEPTEPVELEHGQEQIEVHHGRFRVRLNFKDHNNTETTHKERERTRNRGGRS